MRKPFISLVALGVATFLSFAPTKAQNSQVGPSAYTPNVALKLTPLNNYGFACTNTAAQNTAAWNAAVASGNINFSLNGCGATPFLINATMTLTTGYSLVCTGIKLCNIQPPSNTIGLSISGEGLWLQNIGVVYSTLQTSNTSAIGIQMGNSSTFLYSSFLKNIYISNAYTAMADFSGSFGEFQNVFDSINVYLFAHRIVDEPAPNSGSTFINFRAQNSGNQPSTQDCDQGFTFSNANNVHMIGVNMEQMNCYRFFEVGQSGLTVEDLHFEQINLADFHMLFDVDYQTTLRVDNMAMVFSLVNDVDAGIFNMYDNGLAIGGNSVYLNGLIEYSNSYTNKLPLVDASDNFNKIYLTGTVGRNSGNIVLPSRSGIIQYEQFQFDSPGGKLIAGCSQTAAPSGGMPLPFASATGTALSWVVGDYCNNSAPSATTNQGFVNTTAGSPGTWVARGLSIVAPTITSGFGVGASVPDNNGPSAFTINVGTGGSAATGVIGLPTAAHGWHCIVDDRTTTSAAVSQTKQTNSALSATSCTIGNFTDLSVSGPWAASDLLTVHAFAD